MIEDLQNNKILVAVLLVVGVAGVIFAATQNDIINSVIGEELQDHSGDAMEAGQAMQAQEDLGEESMESEDSMNGSMDSEDSMNNSMDSTDSMNDSMMENDSMSTEQ